MAAASAACGDRTRYSCNAAFPAALSPPRIAVRPAPRQASAGADPVAWIAANPGRIKSMHCKDWAPGKDYAVLFGEGTAPWAKIFAAAEATGGLEYYLIEQEAGPKEEQMKRAEQCLANWKKMRT